MAVSPDGQSVHLASNQGSAVVSYDRGADGRLHRSACVSATGTDGCAQGLALDEASTIAISPDGRNVYVGSFVPEGIAVFSTNAAVGNEVGTAAHPAPHGLPEGEQPAPVQATGSSEALAAPPTVVDGGAAVGQARMPDLSIARLSATMNGGAIRVRLRVWISFPLLARPFALTIRGPGTLARTLRIAPEQRRLVAVDVSLPAHGQPGGRVTVALDRGKSLLEAREGNNTASVRVGAGPA